MPAAARVTDIHVCPLPEHVGGQIQRPGAPTVDIGFQPAARKGDASLCKTGPDTIAEGSSTVIICNAEAARVDDKLLHGGTVTLGCKKVIIGTVGQGSALLRAGAPLVEPCDDGPSTS